MLARIYGRRKDELTGESRVLSSSFGGRSRDDWITCGDPENELLQKRESPTLRAVELIVFALLQASLQRSKTISSGFAGLSLFLSGRLDCLRRSRGSAIQDFVGEASTRNGKTDKSASRLFFFSSVPPEQARRSVLEKENPPLSRRICLFFHFWLVGTTGFEPATPCTPCKCATGLRYVP